ncbi:MAG: ABC transporter ATP-binding protein [Bacillota bacterium]|nr:ABC transporter ATP-binding protein [Bacillota bacterium]MDW7682523.1 ABC transporter ATP-binding protein [Bacillota bacterium]
MRAEPLVKIRNIAMNFHSPEGETSALKDISLDIYEGEFISIVGPSGCGKSTLLNIVAGLVTPTEGSVVINGQKVTGPTSKVGYMPQSDQLFEWRTIWKNVILGLEVQKKATSRAKAYAKELLQRYGLYDFRDAFPSQLSGGMRQRAALIRTLAIDPEIMLLDEAFSALDYQTRLVVADEVKQIIADENKTAVLVTHDISEAISMADRVVVFTKRPGTIKTIHDIVLTCDTKTPIKCREAVEFKDYFNLIWKELDIHV